MYLPGPLALPSSGFANKVFGGKRGGSSLFGLDWASVRSEANRNEPLVAYYGLTQETIGILGNAPERSDPTRAGEHQGDVMGDWHERLLTLSLGR